MKVLQALSIRNGVKRMSKTNAGIFFFITDSDGDWTRLDNKFDDDNELKIMMSQQDTYPLEQWLSVSQVEGLRDHLTKVLEEHGGKE